MSYIGRGISNLSDRTVLDSITTSATATYNLLLNTVAYVPSSAESLTVSLNGVIQAPQSSYTVSGSTIIFASNLASSDVIDFILAERAITLTTIGSGTVTTSNIVDSNVTTQKIANNAITSEKLASGLLPTNTPSFYATMSGNQNLSNSTATKLNFDTEVFDTDSKYDTSNFRFTPSTVGKYFVTFSMLLSSGSGIGAVQVKLRKNGSDVLKTQQAHFYGAAEQSYMISGIINCDSSSDYIEAFGEQNSGSTKPVIATVTSSFFQAYKLIGA